VPTTSLSAAEKLHPKLPPRGSCCCIRKPGLISGKRRKRRRRKEDVVSTPFALSFPQFLLLLSDFPLLFPAEI
jgi:hypothetical protein